MEGGVYKASWKKESGKFTIRLKGHPKLIASKRTYDEAETAILDLITEKLGDGEAYIEFDKPLPKSEAEARYTNPDIVSLGANERAETFIDSLSHSPDEYAKELKHYFKNGVCSECLCPLGPRNNRQMIFRYISGNGGFTSYGLYTTLIFSDEFIKSICLDRNKDIRLIPVKTMKKVRKKYFEIVGKPKYKFVGNADMAHTGWTCGACGVSVYGYHLAGLPFYKFIHLQKSPNGFFICGDKTDVKLCTTRTNWLKTKKTSSSKGLIAEQIGVIRDARRVKNPKLRVDPAVPEKPLSRRRQQLKEKFLEEVAEDKLKVK
jgi:hypothetical protein